jgi:Tfp pilus assembly protein PilO
MDLNKILKSIFVKKSVDNIFIVFFLLVFSVFIIFAIEPSIKTAFSLKKEELDLKKIDQIYEEKISYISVIQSQIEENRDNLPLLKQSISEKPDINKIINDIKAIADKNSTTINKASLLDVNLSKTNKNLQDIKYVVEATSNFDNIKLFIKDLLSQRRLKTISNMEISRDNDASYSGELKVTFTIDGFYL